MPVPHVRLKFQGTDGGQTVVGGRVPIHFVYHLGYEGLWMVDGIVEVPVSDDAAIKTLLFRNFDYADDSIVLRPTDEELAAEEAERVAAEEAERAAAEAAHAAQVVADVERAVAEAKAAEAAAAEAAAQEEAQVDEVSAAVDEAPAAEAESVEVDEPEAPKSRRRKKE